MKDGKPPEKTRYLICQPLLGIGEGAFTGMLRDGKGLGPYASRGLYPAQPCPRRKLMARTEMAAMRAEGAARRKVAKKNCDKDPIPDGEAHEEGLVEPERGGAQEPAADLWELDQYSDD
jgi:hypothetical protein